jgi:hypothetical protein
VDWNQEQPPTDSNSPEFYRTLRREGLKQGWLTLTHSCFTPAEEAEKKNSHAAKAADTPASTIRNGQGINVRMKGSVQLVQCWAGYVPRDGHRRYGRPAPKSWSVCSRCGGAQRDLWRASVRLGVESSFRKVESTRGRRTQSVRQDGAVQECCAVKRHLAFTQCWV